jgi:hypothetical protein
MDGLYLIRFAQADTLSFDSVLTMITAGIVSPIEGGSALERVVFCASGRSLLKDSPTKGL